MLKIIISSLIAAFAVQFAYGSDMQQKIEQILARKDQQGVEYTISVIDPQTGSRIYGCNPLKPLTPASNMKLLTSFTALKTLGSDYKFITKAGLVGNKLVIIGSGDPLLGYEGKDFVSPVIAALKAKNIKQIEIIAVDSSIFDEQAVNPNWPREQLNRDYSSEVSGLNYNGNCIKITVKAEGGKAVLEKSPNTEFVRLLNNVSVISKGESAVGSNRTEVRNTIVVYGKCRAASSFDVAVEQSGLFLGTLIYEAAYRAGISVLNPLTEEKGVPQPMEIIAKFETPITEVLHHCNKNSLNIAAESLFKTVAAKTSGKAGSWQAGRDAVGNYLLSLGADNTEFYIDDGSGLSSTNKVSSNVISLVLLDAYRSPLWPTFKQTLAVGGVDGTIRKQFYKDKYKSRVFAKTGYINGVRALSGICVSASGREYIFSIIANKAKYPTKKAISDIVETIIDEG